MSVLYLSGPMSLYKDEGYNYEAFAQAADHLRDFGHTVLNPAETAGGVTDRPRPWYLRIDVNYILAADALVALPEWEKSEGAKLEILLAHNLQLPVFEYDVRWGLGRQLENITARLDYAGRVSPATAGD